MADCLPDGQLWIGLAGIPAAGKSTTSSYLHEALIAAGISTVVVPMDGYHFYRHELDQMADPENAHARRGAPFTFNAAKFVEDLKRCRQDKTCMFPSFDHVEGDPVERAIEVLPSHKVVLIEGNYLYLPDSPWNEIPSLLDDKLFITVDLDIATDRVYKRHLTCGCDEVTAKRKAEENDAVNARLIMTTQHVADFVIESR